MSILDSVRNLPGRRFDFTNKLWTVPVSSKKHVEEFARRHNFNLKGLEKDPFETFNYNIPDMPNLTVEIPLKRELFPFQKQGVAYALKQKRLIIGDQPGLGKTATSIATITSANAFPCLVICPSSLKINWEREWDMWTAKKAIVLNDSVKRTFTYFYESGMTQVFITNYESLKKYFVAEIKQEIGADGKKEKLTLKNIVFNDKIGFFKSVIVDESHRVKDLKTQQTKFTKGICKGKEYILLLTGTPVVNKPVDLISQLGIIDRMEDFGGYRNFVSRFCDKGDRWRELNVLLRRNCFFRREKTDVLKQLPAKMRAAVLCDITTRKEYNDALADLETYLKRYRQASDEQIEKSLKGEIMVRIGILKNISARGKLPDVIDYVGDVIDSGEKIILFVHLREVADTLKRFFPAAVTILGADDAQTRQRNIDRFQNDSSCQLIICSIKAAGVGITLTASSRVAFVELPWHPADCEQAEDRAHRIGQTDSVQCTYFLGKDTIDEWIYKVISEKREMTKQITGAREEIEESVINGVINLLSKKVL
jgi:SWI/SNF-related matrix-associated actin-dependent regulator 1 of chromatin subfamily A